MATVCAQTGKKVSLEMGGKNAIIVMDDAPLELAVDGAIWGGVRHLGAALHRGEPCDRPRSGVEAIHIRVC